MKNYQKEYYNKHKEKIRSKANASYVKKGRVLKTQQELKANQLLHSCKHSSKKRGIEFDLKKEDINIPDICPILKRPFTYTVGEGHSDYNPSIDRIDNSKGYTKDNIQIISHLANRMKYTASKEDLVLFAKGVLELYEH